MLQKYVTRQVRFIVEGNSGGLKYPELYILLVERARLHKVIGRVTQREVHAQIARAIEDIAGLILVEYEDRKLDRTVLVNSFVCWERRN